MRMPQRCARRVGLAACAAWFGATALVMAQEPRFRGGVTLVEVSAIVTRDGVPVTDLTSDEITVFDEDEPQALVSFEFVDLTAPDGVAQGRDYVLVVDDRHISPRLTKATREVARSFITALSPADRLAFVNTGSRELVQQLSTDHLAAERLALQVNGQRIGLHPMQAESDALTTLEVLRRVAAVLAREGTSERRAVVLVSEGPRVLPQGPRDEDTPALRSAWRTLLRDAAAANVAIYAIDPRGLEAGSGAIRIVTNPRAGPATSQAAASAPAAVALTAEQSAASMASRHLGTLGQLSSVTGGLLTVDNNDLGRSIPLVIRDSRQYYRLVHVQPEPRPGEPSPGTRRIRVSVSRPGVEVRARQQYVPR